jgi:hypothetical protein
MTKADETFQESVQALANWVAYLEQKKTYYTRQLERASQQGAQKPPEETEIRGPAAPDLDADVPEPAAELPQPELEGTWVRVESGDWAGSEDAELEAWEGEEGPLDPLDDWGLDEEDSNGQDQVDDLSELEEMEEMDAWDQTEGQGREEESARDSLAPWL